MHKVLRRGLFAASFFGSAYYAHQTRWAKLTSSSKNANERALDVNRKQPLSCIYFQQLLNKKQHENAAYLLSNRTLNLTDVEIQQLALQTLDPDINCRHANAKLFNFIAKRFPCAITTPFLSDVLKEASSVFLYHLDQIGESEGFAPSIAPFFQLSKEKQVVSELVIMEDTETDRIKHYLQQCIGAQVEKLTLRLYDAEVACYNVSGCTDVFIKMDHKKQQATIVASELSQKNQDVIVHELHIHSMSTDISMNPQSACHPM